MRPLFKEHRQGLKVRIRRIAYLRVQPTRNEDLRLPLAGNGDPDEGAGGNFTEVRVLGNDFGGNWPVGFEGGFDSSTREYCEVQFPDIVFASKTFICMFKGVLLSTTLAHAIACHQRIDKFTFDLLDRYRSGSSLMFTLRHLPRLERLVRIGGAARLRHVADVLDRSNIHALHELVAGIHRIEDHHQRIGVGLRHRPISDQRIKRRGEAGVPRSECGEGGSINGWGHLGRRGRGRGRGRCLRFRELTPDPVHHLLPEVIPSLLRTLESPHSVSVGLDWIA